MAADSERIEAHPSRDMVKEALDYATHRRNQLRVCFQIAEAEWYVPCAVH
jgi:hypothetical protein